MKILSPISNVKEIEPLIKAGADEFYAGLLSLSWYKKNKFFNPLNRRYCLNANIPSLEQAKEIIEIAQKNNKEIFLTLNEDTASNEQELSKEIEKLICLSPDGLIVKNISIIKLIKSINPSFPLILSSLVQNLSISSVQFWQENFNFKRIILPRNLTPIEIAEIVNTFPETEFECFIYNDDCYNNMDGFCSSIHFQEASNNKISFVCEREKLYKHPIKEFEQYFVDFSQKRPLCQASLIYHLKNFDNLISVKIVGRDRPLTEKEKLVKFIKVVIDNSERENLELFQKYVIKEHKKLFPKTYCSVCPYA